MTHFNRFALSAVGCPKCHVPPGHACTTQAGKPIARVHAPRLKFYEKKLENEGRGMETLMHRKAEQARVTAQPVITQQGNVIEHGTRLLDRLCGRV